MYHNIRDRNDFYEKFYKYFAQLSKYTSVNNVFSETISLTIHLLEDYINSSLSKTDSLKPLLFLLKQKMDVETRNGLSNNNLLYGISRYVDKIRDYRKKADAIQLSLFKSSIKPGIEFTFSQCQALEDIGTSEQYSEYLDTIFPDSKIKDIVYYITNSRIDRFDKKLLDKTLDNEIIGSGFYFNPKPYKYNSTNKIPVIVNAKNPLRDLQYTIVDFGDKIERKGKWTGEFAIHKEELYRGSNINNGFVRQVMSRIRNNIITAKELNIIFTAVISSFGFDCIIYNSNMTGEEIVIFEPEQTHILGTKLDIEMFKKYLNEQEANRRIA